MKLNLMNARKHAMRQQTDIVFTPTDALRTVFILTCITFLVTKLIGNERNKS